ncbi:MAG TPA: CRISPR-associated helicase Cas3' [Anaerolineae bacterium]
METEYPFVEVERGRWKIDRLRYLSSIKLNLHEALALYLPARRAARQTLMAQPHVANGLEKLATALKQPMTERLVKAANMILAQTAQPERVAIIETVTRGWIERRKIRIAYRGLHARQTGYHIVKPYLIEPALWSDGAYVIGYSDHFDDIAVFKIERIEFAELEPGGNFEIPEHFDEQRMLRYAWGIWSSEGEPERVKLRFLPGDATRRVKETIWHPYQKPVADMPDGGCLWEALVAEPREMIPWIRGWGADVEVLEPPELREALVREAGRLAVQYQVVAPTETPAHRLLWAKADRKSGKVHRLIYHLIDVGQVALALWNLGLSKPIRQRLAAWLGLSIEDAGRLVAFWAALHDLGKASPAFQDHRYMPDRLREAIRRELRDAGLSMPNRAEDRRARHEVISTWALGRDEKLLAEETGLPPTLAKHIAQALGGHHGAWPVPSLFLPSHLKPDDKGDPAWTAIRRELIHDLKHVFQPPTVNVAAADDDNAMLTLFSGVVSVSDWLGSDEETFGYEDQHIPLDTYARYSRRMAECLVEKTGWRNVLEAGQQFDFGGTFGFEANETQREAITTASMLTLPALVILEAPMGSGKTEAAFSIYSQWSQRIGSCGLYIAMPTTATSNQMHRRAEAFLKHRYGDAATALLVHSQALLQAGAHADEADPVEEKDKDGDRAAALAWFLPRKRSLLAPFGVGTVDQALMSVLQTKHFFVRLLGLSHKVVIFDEVHAYDTYMSTLFQRLLTWLRELGASVIVLSATLPEKTRSDLVRAYTGRDEELPPASYPRITLAAADAAPRVVSLPAPPLRTLSLEWMPRAPADIIARLQAELHDGGCAAVICNTVGRAQELYRALGESEFRALGEDLILFHARYPLAWREGIEAKVLAKFGKDRSRRPEKAIVVATQVIEQSLDLDFDVMISDLCPADLLLQRAGRLHRHAAERAHPYRVWIAAPDAENYVPALDRADKFVYEEYVLLRSWLALGAGHTRAVALPDDLSTLIESVYGDDSLSDTGPEMRAALDAAKQKMEKGERGDKFKASQHLVHKPDDEDLLIGGNLGLEEDDPTIHTTFQALTRADAPGLQVVCLHLIDGKLMLEPDSAGEEVDIEAKPAQAMIRELARRTVTIQRGDIIRHLLEAPVSPNVEKILSRWKKIAVLRYHRLLVFENGVCPLHGTPYVLRLTREFGLEITKEAQ